MDNWGWVVGGGGWKAGVRIGVGGGGGWKVRGGLGLGGTQTG